MSNDLALIVKPSAPVAARHKAALSTVPFGVPVLIASNDPLIPADDCRSVMAEMDAALTAEFTHQRFNVVAQVGAK